MPSSSAHREPDEGSTTEGAIERFAAGVAHEARNQIFALSATLDALEARFSSALEHPPHFEVMREELARLTTLMRHMAELGQANPPLLGVGRIADAVLDAMNRVQGVAASKRVELRFQAGEASEARARFDHEHLSRALARFLEHAIRRGSADGVVELALEATSERASLTIDDSGPRLEPAQLARLFEPFYSPGRVMRGLELTLARRSIHEQGASISAESRGNSGLRLTISLPSASNE